MCHHQICTFAHIKWKTNGLWRTLMMLFALSCSHSKCDFFSPFDGIQTKFSAVWNNFLFLFIRFRSFSPLQTSKISRKKKSNRKINEWVNMLWVTTKCGSNRKKARSFWYSLDGKGFFHHRRQKKRLMLI